jgi:hypothetical protein
MVLVAIGEPAIYGTSSVLMVHEIEAGKHVAGKLGEEGYQAGS